jgi:hypothetical protein
MYYLNKLLIVKLLPPRRLQEEYLGVIFILSSKSSKP